MRTYILLLAALCSGLTAFSQLNLLPYPDSLVKGNSQFRLGADFRISTSSNDPILLKAINRFYAKLNRKTGAYFEQDRIKPGLQGQMRVVAHSAVPLSIGMNEQYRLVVRTSGIELNAATTIGAMRGLETLLQLVARDAKGAFVPEVEIMDNPRFAWRGLMIDVARHFIPLDVIRRNIDAMATVKMNVLHLHLTDDEGFRIESKQFPKLHQAGSDGDYYTQDEMKSLIQYALERGILIMPEFDLPGHSQSWFAGYPELASAPGPYTPGPRFKLGNVKSLAEVMTMINTAPTPTIDPTRESVYQFMDKFIGEMRGIFPAAYFHIGADENNGVAWKNNPKIQQFMKKNKIADTRALEDYFVKRMHAVVTKYKYRMVVWEEAFTPSLPKDVIVQKWKPEMGMMGGAPLTISKVVEAGHDVLLSTGFYLDHHFPAHAYYQNQPLMQFSGDAKVGGGKLLGGEAAQWTEIADGNNIEGRIWMNAAAVAERLWSPGSRTDATDMYRRLMTLSMDLDAQGLQHISYYERMLRGWKGVTDTRDLRLLTDVLVPVKGYKRLMGRMVQPAGKVQGTAPLNEVADILPVNSFTRRQFRQWVSAYLSTQDRDAAQQIRQQLKAWSSMTWNSYQQPALEAIRPHANNLAQLAKIAMEAMDQRDQGVVLIDWVNRQQDLLKKAAAPQAETELDVVPELAALINGKLAAEPTNYPLF
jgi:hexosaminidase